MPKWRGWQSTLIVTGCTRVAAPNGLTGRRIHTPAKHRQKMDTTAKRGVLSGEQSSCEDVEVYIYQGYICVFLLTDEDAFFWEG